MELMEIEILKLKAQLQEKDNELADLKAKITPNVDPAETQSSGNFDEKEKLSLVDIARYSRQLIMPEIGVKGQVRMKSTSVLIVGCGGLGCPVAIYLAAAGIGKLGLVDYDAIELSNLHRQVLHTESRLGVAKCQSLATSCTNLNSGTVCQPYRIALDSSNAIELIKQYDIVVDATDNVATRYLLNDACVLTGKPLVSGSVLRFEGQLTVYNYKDSPCYRCLHPIPPPPETVSNCSNSGVLGAVVGVIGCLQALEVIKMASGMDPSYAQKLYLFDGTDGSSKCIKLRAKQKGCSVCGENPTINQLIDYEQFCGSKATDKEKNLSLLLDTERISVWDYKAIVDASEPHLLVDTRHPVELDICKLPTTTHNIILEDLNKPDKLAPLQADLEKNSCPVFVVCRRGNDSQLAVGKLKSILTSSASVQIRDIKGGLHAWARNIDQNFPVY